MRSFSRTRPQRGWVVVVVVVVLLSVGCGSGVEAGSGSCGTAKSQWVALPCGAALASWDGITAYSNGASTGTVESCAGAGPYGERYQCVELVMRYFKSHFGIWWEGNAGQLLENAPRGDVEVYYNGGPRLPVPGDLVVWQDARDGHTALVTAVTTKEVTVLQQNVWGSDGWVALPISGGSVHGPAGSCLEDPVGWAHATVNGRQRGS